MQINSNKIEELRNLMLTDTTKLKSYVDSFANFVISPSQRREILKKSLSLLDITTLNDDDYIRAVGRIAEQTDYMVDGQRGHVAGVCIYSNLLNILNNVLINKDVKKVVVSGGFPTGQLTLEAKIKDIDFALQHHVDEIDIPINRGLFYEDKDLLTKELTIISNFIHDRSKAKLKVILETSQLHSLQDVYSASVIAMQCGADFIKTSTGKVSRGADIYSSFIMMLAIYDFANDDGGKVVGFKVAGGIRTCEQVVQYYLLMRHLFPEQYISPDTMRIGCSNLKQEIINNLQ